MKTIGTLPHVLAVALTLAAAARAAAQEPAAEQQASAALQRNIHDIRAVLERERAQAEANKRANWSGLIVESRDAPSIGRMREQLAQQLEHLESRCFGIDVEVNEGNAMVICGNNNGEASNANVTNDARTTVVVAPPPSPEQSDEQQAPAQAPIRAEDAP
jgi:hypothetical protein